MHPIQQEELLLPPRNQFDLKDYCSDVKTYLRENYQGLLFLMSLITVFSSVDRAIHDSKAPNHKPGRQSSTNQRKQKQPAIPWEQIAFGSLTIAGIVLSRASRKQKNVIVPLLAENPKIDSHLPRYTRHCPDHARVMLSGVIESDIDLRDITAVTHLHVIRSDGILDPLPVNFQKVEVPPFCKSIPRAQNEMDCHFQLVSVWRAGELKLPVPGGFDVVAYSGPGDLEHAAPGLYRLTNVPRGRSKLQLRLAQKKHAVMINPEAKDLFTEVDELTPHYEETKSALNEMENLPSVEDKLSRLMVGIVKAGAIRTEDGSVATFIRSIPKDQQLGAIDALQSFGSESLAVYVARLARISGLASTIATGPGITITDSEEGRKTAYTLCLNKSSAAVIATDEAGETAWINPSAWVANRYAAGKLRFCKGQALTLHRKLFPHRAEDELKAEYAFTRSKWPHLVFANVNNLQCMPGETFPEVHTTREETSQKISNTQG